MRLYISADIEGICGVVSREHTAPGGFEYERARDWMTDSVVAVCEAARAGGVDEIVVSDSHGNGQNLRIEQLPSYTQLVRAWPRPLGMMQGIEVGKFDGAVLLGYHAAATNTSGVLAHTMSGELIQEVKLNGKSASEASISAAIAGQFGVPVLMVASDDVGVAETRDLLGDIATATLKHSYGTTSALSPAPEVALARLREGTKDALSRIGRLSPHRIEGTVEVEVRLRTRTVAEWLSYLHAVDRPDAFTIRYRAVDMIDASKFLMFLIMGKRTLTS